MQPKMRSEDFCEKKTETNKFSDAGCIKICIIKGGITNNLSLGLVQKPSFGVNLKN